MSKEVLKLALKALEEAVNYTSCPSWSPSMTEECNAAIAAIQEALRTPAGNWKGSTIEELDKLVNSSLSRIGLCFELERLLWERNR